MTNKMADLRVLDAVDDLIDDLVTNMRNTLDDLDRQLERITSVRATVAASLEQLRPTPVDDKPAKVVHITTPAKASPLHAVPPVDAHICDVCGDVLPSAHGLSTHKGRKHKPESFTSEPITKTPVNEQAARAAAAAAL